MIELSPSSTPLTFTLTLNLTPTLALTHPRPHPLPHPHPRHRHHLTPSPTPTLTLAFTHTHTHTLQATRRRVERLAGKPLLSRDGGAHQLRVDRDGTVPECGLRPADGRLSSLCYLSRSQLVSADLRGFRDAHRLWHGAQCAVQMPTRCADETATRKERGRPLVTWHST